MTKTATLVETLERKLSGSHHAVYRLEPPFTYLNESIWGATSCELIVHVYVAADRVRENGKEHEETGIYPAMRDLKQRWQPEFGAELAGTGRGTLNHRVALADLGYEVVTK